MALIRYRWRRAGYVGLGIVAVFGVVFTGSVNSGDRVRVIEVTDGDTLKCETENGVIRVRVWGVDCPEMRQKFGVEATAFVADLCFERDVILVVKDRDHYGRQVCEVELEDGRDLANTIIGAGWGWWYFAYARGDRVKQRLQDGARVARAGLWADLHSVAPWTWRSRRRAMLGSPGAFIPCAPGLVLGLLRVA